MNPQYNQAEVKRRIAEIEYEVGSGLIDSMSTFTRMKCQLQAACDEVKRLTALCDLHYANGVDAGWNCETAEGREKITAARRSPARSELKSLAGDAV